MLDVAAPDVAGVVHQDVQPAEPLHREADQPAADLFTREVALDVLCLAPRGLDAPHRLQTVVAVQAVDHDVGAEPGEVLRDAAADP